MEKIKVGICIEDAEYKKRFINCLMNHYRAQLEMHIFSGIDQLIADRTEGINIVVMECDEDPEALSEQIKIPVLMLRDLNGKEVAEREEDGIFIVEKYQEVNYIVDEILKHIGSEIRDVQEYGEIRVNTKVMAVYSLSENEFQLPFAVTLGSILGEREKVLILDMQENSGFSQLINCENAGGLEELVVMAESGRFSYSRMVSCIGHMEKLDYVYPIVNSETLCEMNAATYSRLTQMLCQELDYDAIIINIGARFMGFYEMLNNCSQVYLMQKKGGLCQWREYEFMDEIDRRGFVNLRKRISKVEVPLLSSPATSCERLIEQWKWNEFGDVIRSMLPEVAKVG